MGRGREQFQVIVSTQCNFLKLIKCSHFQKKKRATTRLEITLHGRVGAMNFRLIIWGVWNLMAKVSLSHRIFRC